MELVVICLLLESLKRPTTGGAVQLLKRGLLVVVVDAAGLGSHAVSLELMELLEVLGGEGEFTHLVSAGVTVVEVDVFFKGIRPLKVLVTLGTHAVLILERIFNQNFGNTV